MKGAAVYGFFWGLGAVFLTRIAPQPAGSVIWWGVLAVQLTWGATRCWRRTGLPFASAAMAIGAAGSALLAVLATQGRVFPNLPLQWWVPIGVLLISAPLCLGVESVVHREQWERWRAYMEHMTAWDIIAGRHFPRLRDNAAKGA